MQAARKYRACLFRLLGCFAILGRAPSHNQKELPLTPYGIRFLTADSEPVPYDTILLLGLHSIWKSRMAVRHADVNARTVREYFIDSVKRLRECYKKINSDLEWLPVLDELVKPF